jgi:hypothetical protein
VADDSSPTQSSWSSIRPATLGRVRRPLAVAILVAAFVPASAATAGDVQSFRVVDAGHPETQAFAPDVFVTIESPGAYVMQSPGVWSGPPYAAAQQPAEGGTTRIDWAVTFRDRAAETPTAAAAANTNGWPVDQRFGLSVPLFVANRLVGTLPAYAVVTQAGVAHKARFEASAAVPLGAGTQAIVHFLTPAPAADDSAWGPYLVQGQMLASTWNRGEVLQALTLVRVAGNLAPKTISIRVDRAARAVDRPARAVRGKVVDPFFNPLVGVPVVEQRWSGKAWKPTRVGRTTNAGTYLIAAGTGRFRTVVSVNGTSLTSAEVAIP